MAKIQKKDGSLVIKKSFWSVISIWWTLVFLIAVPVGGVFVGIKGEGFIKTVAVPAAAASFVLTLIILIVKLISVKRTSWTFVDGAVIYKTGRVFGVEEVTRDMEFFPGMSVNVRRTLKGNFCRYADVILTNGAGEEGEIVMSGAKHPRKVRKALRAMVTAACATTATMMSPYKMYPQMYRHVLGGYPAYYYSNMQMQNKPLK